MIIMINIDKNCNMEIIDLLNFCFVLNTWRQVDSGFSLVSKATWSSLTNGITCILEKFKSIGVQEGAIPEKSSFSSEFSLNWHF